LIAKGGEAVEFGIENSEGGNVRIKGWSEGHKKGMDSIG